MAISENVVHFILVAAALILVMFVLTRYRDEDVSYEEFADTLQQNPVNEVAAPQSASQMTDPPSATEPYVLNDGPDGQCGPPPVESTAPVKENEDFQELAAPAPAADGPTDCYPKDQLTAQDLLPSDANSKWAQLNPVGQGDVQSINFLNAGYHIGVNTTGQTLRNSNLSLRSEPPNPQLKVSPWMQTTIEPDTNRRALEIGGCA